MPHTLTTANILAFSPEGAALLIDAIDSHLVKLHDNVRCEMGRHDTAMGFVAQLASVHWSDVAEGHREAADGFRDEIDALEGIRAALEGIARA